MRYLLIPVFVCTFFSGYSKGVDTTKLYFDLGITTLKPEAKHTLDSLLYNDILIAGKKIGIVGYADFIGSPELNIRISEDRAKNVQNYLLSMGIKQEDIQTVIGNGEVSRNDTTIKSGYLQDRRVDIIPGGIKGWKPPVKPPVVVVKEQPIDISKLKKNEAIRLNKIFFYPGSHKVKEGSLPELDNLYKVMKDNPKLEIRIEGHICCLTENNTDGYDYDSQDFKLSVNRAKEIYDYLEEKGIDESRLEFQGFGKTRPLVRVEKTEADEDMNRRVEIRITNK